MRTLLGIIVSLTLMLATLASEARASYLIDPTGGTVLFSDAIAHDDETSNGRALGFTLSYFGVDKTTVDVSTNGNLNFAGDTSFSNVAMPAPDTIARLNPLWDDLIVTSGGGGSVSEKKNAGVTYAVTWNAEPFPTGTRQMFQAVLFGASTTIGAFAFQANDIAFAYQSLNGSFTGGDATVGLDKGDSTAFVSLPGDADGLITDAQKNLLPTTPGQFILFRPDGGGSYTSSVQSTGLPEPASLILSAMGMAGLVARRRRQRNGECESGA